MTQAEAIRIAYDVEACAGAEVCLWGDGLPFTFQCTRAGGHEGQHVAMGDTEIVGVEVDGVWVDVDNEVKA